MQKYTTARRRCRCSPAASLIALGLSMQQRDLFGPVHRTVKIPQKTVKYAPTEKLYDALLMMLAGGHGLVEINSRLRSDPVLTQAFGRPCCAEQSVVQDTLDACVPANVAELRTACNIIYHMNGAGYRHDYARQWQLLDVDLTGLPCGSKAALATKGYFGEQHGRRGRQMGRVLATRYQEVVVDQLYPGNTALAIKVRELVTLAEAALDLDAAKRARTILRLDAGGGSVDDINWAFDSGYQVHCKDYSGRRARKLAATVRHWIDDPLVAGRQLGWVEEPATAYKRSVRRLAARCRRGDGTWGVGVIVSSVEPAVILAEVHLTPELATRDDALLLADAYFYDQRGGGVETANREDKQGLAIGKRTKKRFVAQEMVLLLAQLAHNILMWARRWLAVTAPVVAHYGVVRLVRDVFHVSGRVRYDAQGSVRRIVLNEASPIARQLVNAFQQLLATTQIVVILGET